MVDKKAPELRFKGFTEDWKQCKLGEEVDIFDGTHQTPEYTDEGVKFVSVENISTLETKKYISLTAYEQEYHKKQAEKGDVLMTRIGDVGTSKVIDTAEPLAYYVTLALLKPKEITSDFLAWLIESPEVQRNIWKRTLHIAFPKKINLGEINQIDIFLPNIDEQLKIGDFLKRLDYTITLHQRKLEAMKQLKQAYLQQLFPSDGGDVPKVRFANFNRDWKQCKLGDAVSVTMGQSPNGENYTENPNDNILVQGNADMQKGKVVPRVWTTQITKTAEPGDIILSVRAPVGDVGKTDFNVVLGRGVAGIKGNDYIYQYLIRMKEIGYWTRVSTGSTFESINSNDLKNAVINSPSQNEQYKIGEFFLILDKTITLHQHKLESLNKLKQAYLQKMFI